MDNANDKQLSFPQRNWLLLCIIVAILSPLVVHWVNAGARQRVYSQATEVRDTANKSVNSGSGGSDTSNRVASPPITQPGGGDTVSGAQRTAGSSGAAK
jgi:hypothetical protein